MENIMSAVEDLQINDFQVIPVDKDKRALGKWGRNVHINYDFGKAYGIAVLCGAASNGVEVIDIEGKHLPAMADKIYNYLMGQELFKFLISNDLMYIEKSVNNGYHLIYRYTLDNYSDAYEGSKRLYYDNGGELIIETRGEGAYIVVAPTPGYTPIVTRLNEIKSINYETRQDILKIIETLHQKIPDIYKFKNYSQTPEISANEKPYTVYNYAIEWYNGDPEAGLTTLKSNGWTIAKVTKEEGNDIYYMRRPGKNDRDNDYQATYNHVRCGLYIFSTNVSDFEPNKYYSNFEILCIYEKNNPLDFVLNLYIQQNFAVFRLDDDFFQVQYHIDYQSGVKYRKIVRLKASMAKYEFFKFCEQKIKSLDTRRINMYYIPTLYGKVNVPCYTEEYRQVINGSLNIHNGPVIHPAPGDFPVTQAFLKHIFGDKIMQGLKYIHTLYFNPTHFLPILCLVSYERGTGKSTFAKYMHHLLGRNAVTIKASTLNSDFNSHYIYANLLILEETVYNERSELYEYIKFLVTSDKLVYNEKFVASEEVDVYFHLMFTTNEPQFFAKIDMEETRYFIIYVKPPEYQDNSILDKLKKEAPAFLYWLRQQNFELYGRDGFRPEEIQNEHLTNIKRQSLEDILLDLFDILVDFFYTRPDADFVKFSVGELVELANNRGTKVYSKKKVSMILQREFGVKRKLERHTPVLPVQNSMTCVTTVYTITRTQFFEWAKKYGMIEEETPKPNDDIPF